MRMRNKIIIAMLMLMLILICSESSVLATAERVREDYQRVWMDESKIDSIDKVGDLIEYVVLYLRHINIAKSELMVFENGSYTLTNDELAFENKIATKYKSKMENMKDGKKTVAEKYNDQYQVIVKYQAEVENAGLERGRGNEAEYKHEAQLSATEAKEKAIALMGEDYLHDSEWFKNTYTAEELANKKAEAEKYKKAMENAGIYDSITYNNLCSYITRIEGAEKQNENSNGSSKKFGSSGVIMSMNTGTPIADPTQDASAYNPGDLTDASELVTKAGVILGIIRNIGVVVGVIGLMAIGIRYMFASIEEKAEYKATMMPYVLGCVLLMAGTVIIDFIYSFAVTFGR